MWAEWQTENTKVDEDHQKLTRMIAALSAVITLGGSPAIIAEAIAVLRERVILHFRMEEAVAGKADAEARSILQTDHIHLVAMLDEMEVASRQRGIDLRPRLDRFIAASQRHEVEVDVPLFHMLAKGDSAVT